MAWLTLSQPVLAQPIAPQPTTETSTEAAELDALIKVLRDDSARQALLNGLENGNTAQSAAAPHPDAEVEDISIGQRVAEVTRSFAQAAVSSIVTFSRQLSRAPETLSNLDGEEFDILLSTLRNLLMVIVVTYSVFAVMRLITRRIDRSLGARALRGGFVEKTFVILASVCLDIGIVFVAWAAGYVAALTVFGQLGRMDIEQTLYLNAFIAVQMMKVVIRTILSPSVPDLRLVRISGKAARKISTVFAWVVTILGYGQLLLQPILVESLSKESGQAVSAIVALAALLTLVIFTLGNRSVVSDWLLAVPEGRVRSRAIRFVARRWHWPVIAYLAFLFAVVLIGPAERLFAVLGSSGQAFAAIIIGWMAADWLGRRVSHGVALPENLNQRLPLLERRVNGVVPKFLVLLRLIILGAVLLAVLIAIGILDLSTLTRSPTGLRFAGALVSVFLVLSIAYLLWLTLSSWVDYRLNPGYGSIATAREATLLTLLRNAVTIAIVVIALMFSLSELGLDIAPLLASAGVLGLAIGFGAQKLVQDVINGVFIQLENAINVGDVITIGGITGGVERLTIRSVSLRDVTGAYHIISFSSVEMVTNHMRDFSFHVGDIGIAYRENVDDARDAIMQAFDDIRQMSEIGEMIIEDIEWYGVQELADSAVILRVRIKTLPGKQWGVGRALNEAVKRIFDERGIEIPFPHQTVYFGVDRQGNAPPAHVSMTRSKEDPDQRESEHFPATRDHSE